MKKLERDAAAAKTKAEREAAAAQKAKAAGMKIMAGRNRAYNAHIKEGGTNEEWEQMEKNRVREECVEKASKDTKASEYDKMKRERDEAPP